ncbi:DNA cytosine methyltransferase [Clostridium estertheticum]|uniref:Cytosine-specific methyltransferase n=1 Tax=Clostridium estertheticum TaxID=238834 RepID=A0A7Y3WS16_9CLOT|nr:DNA cytosine methyltransferase [Clostridium estertheticum]NNU76557.1 DNA cytosine methyltransferase [Clostridium estertheticum]WBL49717.1 DNA cytosine methyltransferase [Clostridium estertheticum]
MNISSIFAGAGGMDYGFEQAGFNIVWANEYDKVIWDTYKFNHPNTYLDTRSIKDVPSTDIPDNIDGIIGGPPCQSWSLAGAMKGIEDDRGKLFFEYLRILRDKQPKFFVAENVPGIVSRAHIDSFMNIKRLFADCGYNVSHQTLNANDFGVPQERKRVFLVGYRNDLNLVFDFNRLLPNEYKPNLRDAIGDLDDAIPALDKNKSNGELVIANHEYFIGSFSSMYMSRNRRKRWEQPSFTIQAGGRHAPLHPNSCEMEKVEKDIWKFTNDNYRRLSVRECARIQTFPDGFIFKYSALADAYKMIGNAVPTRLAQAVATQIREDLLNLR